MSEERNYHTGQEPGPFKVTPEEAAVVIALRDAAERWRLDPAEVARLAARGLFLASDVQNLGHEFARIWKKFPADVKASYGDQLDVAASKWLQERAGRLNPDNGHGAADGFGGTDFPPTYPGPDKDRPQ